MAKNVPSEAFAGPLCPTGCDGVNGGVLPRRGGRSGATARRPAAGHRCERGVRRGRALRLRAARLRSGELFLSPMPLPGREGVELIWGGVAWRFASEANREAFARDPEVYAPRIGGYDAGAAAEGRLVAADATLFAIRDGRLYVFRGERSRARFEADASLADKAEARWPELRRDLVRG